MSAAQENTVTDAQTQFEDWYVQNAFDYATNPIGSRDCGLMRRAWHAALAARQPVGEVIEYQSYHGYGGGQWSTCDKKLYDNGKAFEAKYGAGQMSLYRALVVGDAAPPAQVVDLGQFLPHTTPVIDKLQDVMATHGFAVPVRVISDAFRTALNEQRDAAPGVGNG